MANGYGNDKSSLGKINDDFIKFDYTDEHKPYKFKSNVQDILAKSTKSSIRPSDDSSREDIHSSVYSTEANVEQNLGPDASEGSPDTGPWDEHHEQNALENLQNLSHEQFSKINKKMHHSLTKSISKKNK